MRLWGDQLLYKPPGGDSMYANVGCHTDRQHWKTGSSDNRLTAWPPLVDERSQGKPAYCVTADGREPPGRLRERIERGRIGAFDARSYA